MSLDPLLLESAMRSYVRAVAVGDPVRLRVWDARGLTMPQLRLMYLLLRHPCPSVGELADEMKVRPASVTGLTDRLVHQGLIQRVADAHDRRVVRVALAPEGRCVLEEIEAAGRSYLAGILEAMGEDAVRRLIESFDEFSRTARAAAEDVPAATRAHGIGEGHR